MNSELVQIRSGKATASDHLMFAYGTNMNSRVLSRRCAHPVRVSNVFLPNARLAFFGYSREWDGGLETCVEQTGNQLWGVLYAMSAMDWERLDHCQDARLDGNGKYFHYPVQVYDSRGNSYEALTYKLDDCNLSSSPSECYLTHILEGAGENLLPARYMDSLRSIRSVPVHYAVPLSAYGRGSFPHTSCMDCSSFC